MRSNIIAQLKYSTLLATMSACPLSAAAAQAGGAPQSADVPQSAAAPSAVAAAQPETVPQQPATPQSTAASPSAPAAPQATDDQAKAGDATPEPQQSALSDIIVTASKTGGESLQNSASSIQAFDQKSIAQNAMTGFDDYARKASNLSALNKGPGQTQIAFRGIITSNVNFGQPQAQSTTGMYIDDVPVTSAAFNPAIPLVDINRIEILRGPQGTLYGSSAMSGAIRLIPNMPTTERFEGSVNGALSNTKHGDWNYQIDGSLNIPLGRDIAVRGTMYRVYNNGYINNIYTGQEHYNDDGTTGARVIAVAKPSPEFTLTGIFIFNHLKAHGRPEEYLSGDPAVAAGNFFTGGPPTSLISPTESLSQFDIGSSYEVVKPHRELYDDNLKIYSLKANYEFSAFNATLIGSRLNRDMELQLDDYRRIRSIFGPTNAATGKPFIAGLDDNTVDKRWMFEGRLSSKESSRIKWVIGAYYEDYKTTFKLGAPINDLDSFLQLIGGLPTGETSVSYYGTSVPNVLFEGGDRIKGNQKSVFGEITAPVPFVPDDKLQITLGGRYYEYNQTAEKFSAGFVIGRTPTDATFSIKEHGFNPKAAIKFKISPDILFYASVARGFRIGGTNERLPNPNTAIGDQCARELVALGITRSPDTYGSDSLTSYELGAKTSWFNKRLRINPALFYINWNNIQTNVFMQCGFNIVTNEGKQISKGAELEMSALVSDSLTLNLNGSYTDATLGKDSQILSAKKGDRAPYVPRWNVSGGFEYNKPVELFGGESRVYFNGNVSYLGGSYSAYSVNPSVPRLKLPPSVVGNLSLGLDMGKWTAGVFVKNIWNERVVSSIDTDRNVPASYTVGRPRTVGLNVGVHW